MAAPERISEAAEAKLASGIDYTDIPEPEVRAIEITFGDPRLPGGAKNVMKWATEAEGWEIRATYSRGPWLHASGDRYTDICDLVRVRFLDRAARKMVVAHWRRSATKEGAKWSFESAWDWSSQPRIDKQINSDTLKAIIKRESGTLIS